MTEAQIEKTRMKLLEKISEHMIANNITQEEAANKAGFIASNVSRMLAGKFPPTLDNLLKLCNAVGLRLEVRDTLYKKGEE